jgi:salicylate hydroxylase
MARRLRIIMVGGGIGGLAAARALALRGHEVEIHERASTLGEIGAGLQLGPNAVKVMYALGLKEELHRVACMPGNNAMLDWADGSAMHVEPFQDSFAQYGAPYMTVHRADLHNVLVKAVDSAAIRLRHGCVSVSSTEASAVARFADGSQAEGDVMIGADGIRSAVRESLWGKDQPRYTHYLGWRGVLPMERALAAMNDREKAALHRNDVVMWRSPNGTALFYPLRAGELINVFAGKYTDEWAEESWTVPSSHAEMISSFEGWHPALKRALGEIQDVYKWAFFDRDPLPRWTKGRVTLLGDAAHPMMPTLAQGAGITLEDAFALARHLDAQPADPAAALAAYEAERLPRASKVQVMARLQFEDNRKVPRPPPQSKVWIYEHDVTAG